MNVKTLNLGKFPLAVCLLTAQLLTFSTNVFAAKGNGGVIGGGGGDQATKQGLAVLADRYADYQDENENLEKIQYKIGTKVKAEIISMLNLYKSYFGSSQLDSSITDENLMYLAVTELPDLDVCKKRLNYQSLPEDMEISQFACTDKNKTYIVVDKFNKFSNREKALGLIHEGLRRLNANDYVLTSITKGLRIAVENYSLQSKGDLSHKLTAEEKNALFQLSKAAIILSNSLEGTEASYRALKNNLKFTDLGGVIAKNQAVEFKVNLGIGTNFYNVNPKQVLSDETVTLVNTSIEGGVKVHFGKNIFVSDSSFKNTRNARDSKVTIGDNSKFLNANFDNFELLEIQNNVEVSSLILYGSGFTKAKILANTVLNSIYITGCFNTTSLILDGVFDGRADFKKGKPIIGDVFPVWPLTFAKIRNLNELKSRMSIN